MPFRVFAVPATDDGTNAEALKAQLAQARQEIDSSGPAQVGTYGERVLTIVAPASAGTDGGLQSAGVAP